MCATLHERSVPDRTEPPQLAIAEVTCASERCQSRHGPSIAIVAQDTCIALNISVLDAAYQAYALRLVARESAHEFGALAHLSLETRLGEDLRLSAEARLKIMSGLRHAFSAQLPQAPALNPETLGELLAGAVPHAQTGHD